MTTNPTERFDSDLDRRHRARRGMAMVEFVLVLPTLLILLFGMLEFGILFYQWQTLSNAAREGARESIVFRKDCDATALESQIKTVVTNYASSANITVDPTKINVTGLCTGFGTPADVSVTHPDQFKVLPGFVAALSPTLDLVGRSNMRNEGST